MTNSFSETADFATVFGAECGAIERRRDTLGVADAQIQELQRDIARNADTKLAAAGTPPPDVGFPLSGEDRFKPPFGDQPPARALFGLALSGGGIRSAALCLGVTQALNRHGILRLADYVSTVSGGGYLACSLATNWWGVRNIAPAAQPAAREQWARAERRGAEPAYQPVWSEPAASPSQTVAQRAGVRWYFPFPHVAGVKETAMLRQLRDYADYLAPKGLMAAVHYSPALLVRGWVLNGLAVAPILMAAAGLLSAWIDVSSQPWLANGWFDVSDPAKAGRLAFGAILILGIVLLGLYALSRPIRLALEMVLAWRRGRRLGLDPQIADRPPIDPVAADERLDLEWGARDKMRTLVDRTTLFLVLLTSLAVHPYLIWLMGGWLTEPSDAGTAIGVAALAGAAGAAIRQIGALPAAVRRAITVVAGTIVGPLLLWAITLAAAATISGTVARSGHPDLWGLDAWAVGLIVAAVAAPALWLLMTHWLYDCNDVALHAFYRDKLSRAFLFTLHPLNRTWTIHADSLKLSQMETDHAPYPIINVALNMEGDRAHWSRGRKCDFFVFTPKYIGGPHLGYCPTAVMEDVNKRLRLSSAMAISGAAFSAVAGRRTVGFARFLLALFNVRLGYWLPHPQEVADTRSRTAFKMSLSSLILGRRPGPAYFLAELWRGVKSTKRFVYLTDGGHIENTGVYELIRRRCRLIIAVDGEQDDPGVMRFQSIADAIRFARIDFGVQIDIDLDPIRQDNGGMSQRSWAVGTIDYGGGPEGLIVYLKSSLTNDVPEDVWKYRMIDPHFPHQPTTDQFFDEEQFEAYRALGYHIGDGAMDKLVSPEIRQRLCRVQQS